LHFRRIQVEAGCELCGSSGARGLRVFYFGKEIEDQEIDVLDFVEAELHALRCNHVGGMWPLTRKPFLCASSIITGTSSGLTEL